MSDLQELTAKFNRNMIASVFDYITVQSAYRAARWHGNTTPWTVLEWAGAMCGEAGEAANAAKKIRRVETGMKNSAGVETRESLAELNEDFGDELADTFLYLVLCAHTRKIDLAEHIIKVFNRKSQEYGFPERL